MNTQPNLPGNGRYWAIETGIKRAASGLAVKGAGALLLTLTVIAGASRANARDFREGLVSYWPLQTVNTSTTPNTTPDLVSGYDMTLVNMSDTNLVSATISGNSHLTKALSFDAVNTAYLQYTNGGNLPLGRSDEFSVLMWMKAPQQFNPVLYGEGALSEHQPTVGLGGSETGADGTLRFFYRNSNATVYVDTNSVSQPFDDTWHHVALVVDNDKVTMYVDGVLDLWGPFLISRPPVTSMNNLITATIGCNLRDNLGNLFTGEVSDVAVWRRALSQAEVQDVMANSIDTNGLSDRITDDLVSYWPLQTVDTSTTPNTTPDLVSGYDMTLMNMDFGYLLSDSNPMNPNLTNALYFDGVSSYLQYTNGGNAPVAVSPAFTVAAWAKGAGTDVQSDTKIYGESSSQNTSDGMTIGTRDYQSLVTNGSVRVFIRTAANNTLANSYSTGEPFDNSWHHIAVVVNYGVATTYVDGMLDTILPFNNGDFQNNFRNFDISAIGTYLRPSGSGASGIFLGEISDVAVWRRPLSQREIQDVMTNSIDTSGLTNQIYTGLVSHWPLQTIATGSTPNTSPDVVSGDDMRVAGTGSLTVDPASIYGNSNLTNSINFDGQTWLQFTNRGGLLPVCVAPAYSVVAWVKGDGNYVSGHSDLKVFSEGCMENSRSSFALSTRDDSSGSFNGDLRIYMRRADGFFSSSGSTLLGNYTVGEPFDNTWHHVAAVVNSGVVTLYVDGAVDSVFRASEANLTFFDNTTIGVYLRNSLQGYFIGDVADVAVWRRPLSQIEVQNVMANSIPYTPVVVPGSTITGIVMTGPNSFDITGMGNANQMYTLLGTTNVALPVAQWSVLGTVMSSALGDISFKVIDATNSTQFYRLSQ